MATPARPAPSARRRRQRKTRPPSARNIPIGIPDAATPPPSYESGAPSNTYLTRVREDQADAEARTAAEMADSPEVRGQAAEALRCLYSAQTYLQSLTNYEPPF